MNKLEKTLNICKLECNKCKNKCLLPEQHEEIYKKLYEKVNNLKLQNNINNIKQIYDLKTQLDSIQSFKQHDCRHTKEKHTCQEACQYFDFHWKNS